MSSTVIAGLVLLLSATAVLGRGVGDDMRVCVSPQELEAVVADTERKMELKLAAARAEVEKRVGRMQSQLEYWQKVAIQESPEGPAGEGGEGSDSESSLIENNILNIVTQLNISIQLEHEVLDGINETLHEIKNEHQQINATLGDLQQEQQGLEATLDKIQQDHEKINAKLDDIREEHEMLEEIDSTVDQLQQAHEVINNKLDEMSEKLDALEESGLCCNLPPGSGENPAQNCSHILHENPGSPSGYYWILSPSGNPVEVFCDMERVCGCDEGRGDGEAWMRVADINMTRENEECPAGFRKIAESGKTMCGSHDSGCTNTSFTSHGIKYSRVCGKIKGYQFGAPEAFSNYISLSGSIDSTFVDGMVLTHGSPRNHIWSFATAFNQFRYDRYGCPCNAHRAAAIVPPYVGEDYFCDSGSLAHDFQPTYHTEDPLWDGAGCVSGFCCSFNSPPFFCKTLPAPTTDDIELRLCHDGQIDNEDTPFEIVELYVK